MRVSPYLLIAFIGIKIVVMKRLIQLILVLLLGVAAAVQAADGYTYTDMEGKPIKLSDYRGKWVVVNYWATWCPPCLEEIPELISFHDSHKDSNAVVVGINMEKKEPQQLAEFIDDNLISYPVVPMTDDMPLLGNVPGLPTTYLLDPSGKTAAVQVGQVTGDMIEKFIASYPK
jgi:thiol-disulfide isomerase/thioredoxin